MFCVSVLLSVITLAYSELNLRDVLSGEWSLTSCEVDLVDQDQLCDSSVFFYWNTGSDDEKSGSLSGKWFTNTTTNNASIEERFLNINVHGGSSGLIQAGDDVHEIEDILEFRFITLPNYDYVSYGVITQNVFNNYFIYSDDEDEPPQKNNNDEINYSYKWTLSQQLNRFEITVFNTNLNDNNKIFVISGSKIFRDNRSWFSKNMTYIMLGGLFLFNVVFRTYFNPNAAARQQATGNTGKKTN